MFFAFAHIASANVIFSEIAWMGTSESSSNEWMELYNNGGESVDLSGWFIKSGDEDISIDLSGSIMANSYYLIERTDDTTVPNVTANLIASFGHGLSNSGETLILKNSSGSDIETLNNSSGWVAGDSTTKETMQWNGSKWITASPTPKDGNITNSNSDTQNETSTNTISSSNNSASNSSSAKSEPEIVYDIKTDIIAPKVVTAGIPFSIDHQTTGTKKEKIILGKFVWNFGDGMTKSGSTSGPFSYVYQYPGEYVLTLSFYESAMNIKPDGVDKMTIKVIPSGITIVSVGTYGDPYIEIENNSSYEMSLNNFIIKGNIHSFIIPNGMTLLPKSKLKLSPRITGFEFADLSNISIMDLSGQVFASFPNKNLYKVKYGTVQNTNDNIVKSEIVKSDQQEDLNNSSDVINLNDLGASVGNSSNQINNKLIIYLGFIGILIIGITSIILIRRKDEVPDYVEGEISAKDMTIIE